MTIRAVDSTNVEPAENGGGARRGVNAAKHRGSVAESATAGQEAWSKRRTDLLAIGSYVIGALFITVRLFAHLGHRLPDKSGDRALSEYFLAFSARIITHGDNPFFIDQLNAPIGVNTMANTSILGLGVPMTPITLLFGPSVTFDLLIVIGIAGTAAAWYWVLSRHLLSSRAAAWVGGLIGGFAPSVITHTSYHPNLTAQFLVPFLVWRTIRLREPGRWLRNGLALAGLAVYQAFINEETLFLTGLALGLFLVLYAVLRREEARAALRPMLAGLGVALAASVVLLAYPLWCQFAGTGSYRGAVSNMTQFHIDMLGLTSFASNSVAQRLSAFGPGPALGSEEHGFFGWPLLVLVITLVLWRWREPLVRCAAITGATFAVLSFGVTLTVRDHSLGVPGPFALLKHLPLFDTVLPTRFGQVTTWVVAPIVALGVERLRNLPSLPGELSLWPRRVLIGGALAAALVPAAPLPIRVVARPVIPPFVASGAWRSYVGPDQSVLVVPLSNWDNYTGMLWAASTGLDMKMSHGYFLGPTGAVNGSQAWPGPAPRPTNLLLDAATYTRNVPKITEADRVRAREDLAYWHTAIIMTPDQPATRAIRATINGLVGPGQLVGGVWVWDVGRR